MQFAFNIAAHVHHDSKNIFLCLIQKKTQKPAPTWVLAADLALYGLGQLGFSLPLLQSQDGTPPPLSPDEGREKQ